MVPVFGKGAVPGTFHCDVLGVLGGAEPEFSGSLSWNLSDKHDLQAQTLHGRLRISPRWLTLALQHEEPHAQIFVRRSQEQLRGAH